jgi:hypothetical protein
LFVVAVVVVLVSSSPSSSFRPLLFSLGNPHLTQYLNWSINFLGKSASLAIRIALREISAAKNVLLAFSFSRVALVDSFSSFSFDDDDDDDDVESKSASAHRRK